MLGEGDAARCHHSLTAFYKILSLFGYCNYMTMVSGHPQCWAPCCLSVLEETTMGLIITLSSPTLDLVSTLSAEWSIQHQVIRHHHSRCSLIFLKPHHFCYQEDGWSASLTNLEYSSTLATSYQPMTVSRGRKELFTGEGPSLLLLINIVFPQEAWRILSWDTEVSWQHQPAQLPQCGHQTWSTVHSQCALQVWMLK